MAIKITVEGPIGSGKSSFIRDLEKAMLPSKWIITRMPTTGEELDQLLNSGDSTDLVFYSEKITPQKEF